MEQMKSKEYFNKLRVESGLTQRDVARALGFSSIQFISNVERGLSYYSKDHLEALSELFGVPRKKLASVIVEEKYNKIKEKYGL